MIGKLGNSRATASRFCDLQPLHPERRARAGPAPRQQQRARRVLAEARREQRRVAELLDDQVFDQLRDRGSARRRRAARRRRRSAARCRRRSTRPAPRSRRPCDELRFERQRPRRVHARAERRQDADAPVAELVAEALDRDRAIGRQRAGRFALLARGDRAGCARRTRRGGASRAATPRLRRAACRATSRTNAPSARPSSIGRPGPSPRQNGSRPTSPGAGATITRSRVISTTRQVDAPSMIVCPGRDSKTISSSSSPTRGPSRADVHGVHAAIGNRAAREQRELRGAARRREHVALAIPDEARSQLGELGGRIAAGEHVEHRDQRVARQIAEVRRAPHRALELVHLPRRDAAPSRRSAAPARRADCAGSRSPRRRPASMPWHTTVASSRSPRCLG